jgi:hypothetical protein
MTTVFDTRGTQALGAKWRKRKAYFESERPRKNFQDLGRFVVQTWQANVGAFRPGKARDLSPAYKKLKRELVGRIYPVLWLTGAMVSSLTSRVFKERARWRVKVWHAGQHPLAGMSNQALAEKHIASGRNHTVLPEGWAEPFTQRLINDMWAIK